MYSGLGWTEEGDGIGNFYAAAKPQDDAQQQQLALEHPHGAHSTHQPIHHPHSQHPQQPGTHAHNTSLHAHANHHATHHTHAAHAHAQHAAHAQHPATHLTPPHGTPHGSGHGGSSHGSHPPGHSHHSVSSDQPHGPSSMRAQFSSLFENCASSMAAQSTPDPDGLEKEAQMEQRSKAGDDRAKWSDPARLKFLLRGYMGSIKEGKVTPFGLKKSQWNEILTAFNDVFEIQHSVEQLKNGFGNLKRQFKDTQFLRNLPGWCWHEKERAVYNSPEAWTEAIKKFPFRNLSRLIGVRSQEMWSSKSLELYCGMFDDLEIICNGLSYDREDIMVFSELVALSKGHTDKERGAPNDSNNKTTSRKRDRPGGELVADHGEPPVKHVKHDRSKEEQILSVLDEMKGILAESQKKTGGGPPGPSPNLQQAISEMMPFKNQLGRDFGRGLLLMKDEGNATIFLNLDYEDRLNFIFTLLRSSPPTLFPSPLLPPPQENPQPTGSST